MDTKNQIIWQELIETKDFDQLSNSEKGFVLGVSSEKIYQVERAIVLRSKNLYEDIEPKPLIFKEEKSAIVIPLYQAILAIAATFILAFFLFRGNETILGVERVQPVASTDTVFVEKRIVDTLIETKIKYQRVEVPITLHDVSIKRGAQSSVLSNQPPYEADLSTSTLSNRGTSASNDETLILVENWTGPN